jgi:hypothetical protein
MVSGVSNVLYNVNDMAFSNTDGSLKEKETLTIYPNPSSDRVFIEIPENALGKSLIITTLTGKMVKELLADNSITEVDISNLPKGFYLTYLKSESDFPFGKFIKR